jgi:hypothetical protein
LVTWNSTTVINSATFSSLFEGSFTKTLNTPTTLTVQVTTDLPGGTFTLEVSCPTIPPTPTPSVTPTRTATSSITPSITPSITSTVTPTNTQTPSITPTTSVTPSITPTNTRTPTVTPSPIFCYARTFRASSNTNGLCDYGCPKWCYIYCLC